MDAKIPNSIGYLGQKGGTDYDIRTNFIHIKMW